LVAGAAALIGAPAAAAAGTETPVVSLDPPDAELFLVPTENYGDLLGGPAAASTGDAAPVELAEAAAMAPPEIAATFGADVTESSHLGNGEVDVEYGGTVDVRLPALVDATAVKISVAVLADDPEADPRVYSTDPAAVDPLVVADLGGNEFTVTLPADDGVFGPEAVLLFDGLESTAPNVTNVYPLAYYLAFTGPGTGSVTLEPAVGLFTSATCPVAAVTCPSTDVQAGDSFGLRVPAASLLRTLDFGRLDTAEVSLLREDDDWESAEEYDSTQDAGLLTRHGPSTASVNLPDDMGAGAYYGAVIEGSPLSGGFSMTSFEVDVAAVPLNAGLHSDTGWVDDVRDASAGSTKAVAGVTMLVVAGLITVVAVVPRRRPPAEG
jgi:hypothetical protein